MSNDENKTLDDAYDAIRAELLKHIGMNGGFISQGALMAVMFNGGGGVNSAGSLIIQVLDRMVEEGDVMEMKLKHKALGGFGQPYYVDHNTEIHFTDNSQNRTQTRSV